MSRWQRIFGRYRQVIPDFEAFLETTAVAAPAHLRVNRLKAQVPQVLDLLARWGVAARPEPWFPDLLRLDREPGFALGSTLLHALGHVYVQSAASALAAVALGAQPGHRVLDLCAAPGSKTTLLAQFMDDRGCLVANEPRGQRLKSLIANLDRMGVSCAVAVSYSGQNLPARHRFDRVLVDAPCSGEGTWRGPNARPKVVKAGFRDYLARQQGALLRRGYEVLEPGGVLVYSTCTYAPEENEAILAGLLVETDARMLPLDVPVPAAPGLTAWNGESYPDALAHAARLYPHRFDSEGFFVARLAKPG